MIKKIACVCIFISLLIALPLGLMGYKYVTLGPQFTAFMKATVRDLENWKFEIPNIPTLEPQQNAEGWELVLNILKYLANFFIGIYNFAITIMNIVIYIIQFFIAIIKHLIELVKNVQESGYTSYPSGWLPII